MNSKTYSAYIYAGKLSVISVILRQEKFFGPPVVTTGCKKSRKHKRTVIFKIPKAKSGIPEEHMNSFISFLFVIQISYIFFIRKFFTRQ